METAKKIRAEIIQLLQKQFEALGLAACNELTDAEWQEYDARENSIRELQARLSQFGAAA